MILIAQKRERDLWIRERQWISSTLQSHCSVLQHLCVQAGTWVSGWEDKQTGEELYSHIRRAVVNGLCWSLKPDFFTIPRETLLGLLLLGVFIGDVEERLQNILLKFVDVSKPGFAAKTLQGRATIQSNGPRECEDPTLNPVKLNEGKCKVLHPY